FYGFAVKRESALDVYSKRRIIDVTDLKIVEWHSYKHLDWITIDELYKFSDGMLNDVRNALDDHLKGIRMQYLPQTIWRKAYLLEMEPKKILIEKMEGNKEAYTAYSNPRGFIYQNKDKKNRLMQIDELHKFSDGMLNDVRNALDDRLKGIRMQYLPQTIWRKGDNDRAAATI
nr:hypothetical protein [Tanacetum cinerariifolium]